MLIYCDQYLFVRLVRDKENGYTALMFAAVEGDEIIVDVLLACVSILS